MKVPRDIFIPSTKFHATHMHLTDEVAYLYKNTAEEIELGFFLRFARTRSSTARPKKEQQYIQEYFLKRYTTIPITISQLRAWEWHEAIVKMSCFSSVPAFLLCLSSWWKLPRVLILSTSRCQKQFEGKKRTFNVNFYCTCLENKGNAWQKGTCHLI